MTIATAALSAPPAAALPIRVPVSTSPASPQRRRRRGVREPAAKLGNSISSASALYAGRAIDLRKDGDAICAGGRKPFAHSHYV